MTAQPINGGKISNSETGNGDVMSLKELGITRKTTGKMLIASINFRDDYERKNIPSMFERLFKQCKEHVCGPAITLYNYGVYSNGIDVEVCFPVTQPIETDDVRSRNLESVEVFSIIHNGPLERIRESYSKLYGYFREHGIVGTNFGREIRLKFNSDNPEENVTEVQAVLHKWNARLAKNLDRILGSDARKEVMQDSDKLFTLESTNDERAAWVKTAMKRLDERADEEQKYDILSCCAHDFSQNHKKAKNKDEKRKYYCHCSMVRNHLKEGISPTFCYCGSGWYRQQWEGILGKPVRVKIQKSLLKDDDTCEFTIHLPPDVKLIK